MRRPRSGAAICPFLLPVVLFLLTVQAAGAPLCVDARNTGGAADGTSQHPYSTVQSGVDAAASGDTVKVAGGAYEEDVRIEGKVVSLLGGFTGAASDAYLAGAGGDFDVRDTVANPVELLGTGTDAVVTLLEAGASIVDGLRITGGRGSTVDLPYASNGGGIYVSGGAPHITNNLIETNDARQPGLESFGGGIYARDADVTIENNIIRNNTAGRGAGIDATGGAVVRIAGNTINGNVGVSDHGGGMYVGSPNATITRNTVYDNEVGRALEYGWGAGIMVFNPGNSAHLSYNVVFHNYSPGQGAGIFVDEGCTAVLEHELVFQNEVEPGISGGGAIYVDGGEIDGVATGSLVTIVNCTIADNPVTGWYVGGNGLLVEGHSAVTVRNTIFWGNGDDFLVDDTSSLTVTHSDSEEPIAGIGNISEDPLFADQAGADFHLKSDVGRWDSAANGNAGAWVTDAVSSPCIDAGDPADPFAQETEPNGGRIDMGVYGNTSEASRSLPGEGEGEGEGEGTGCFGASLDTEPHSRLFSGDHLLTAFVAFLLALSARPSSRPRVRTDAGN